VAHKKDKKKVVLHFDKGEFKPESPDDVEAHWGSKKMKKLLEKAKEEEENVEEEGKDEKETVKNIDDMLDSTDDEEVIN
jgi:hypothetical protein